MTASPGTSLLVEFFPMRIHCRRGTLTTPAAAALSECRNRGRRPSSRHGERIDAGFRRPVIVSLMSLAIGSLLIRETKDRDIQQDF